MNRGALRFLFVIIFFVHSAFAQAPVKVIVHTDSPGYAVPATFVGLGFETLTVIPDSYGRHGYFFSPENKQLITLFRNAGIKHIRVGGGTVDGSGTSEHCVTPTPNFKDIDNLFLFARAAGIKVIYSVRLENLASCPNPKLPEDDARIVRYIWQKYRANIDSFAIGNEPDVPGFHTRPGRVVDAAIYETKPGSIGSAYPSYIAEWKKYAAVIHKAVPGAKFSGPDTGSGLDHKGTHTPNSEGVSWTQAFVDDVRGSGMLTAGLQHLYVWGRPSDQTAQEAIDAMLSSAWDEDPPEGKPQWYRGGPGGYLAYPYVFKTALAKLVDEGVPYRMTEANDCLRGVHGASDGFAAALWALDFMHWWAAHHMAGVNFWNKPGLPTDTIFPVPDPTSCDSSGCGNYRVTPKALGMKAFSLGSHGFEEPITLGNPDRINLTAYAIGTAQELYVTVINKTHTTTHDATDARVEIDASGFDGAQVETMVLTDGEPGNGALMTGTLGGSGISSNAPWAGKWSPAGRVQAGKTSISVQSTTAAIVRIRRPKESRVGRSAKSSAATDLFR